MLNEVVIRCEIVATNYLYSFIWRNFMIKYCIIICWMNVVNECSEWRIILYIWIKLSWKGCAKVCWWSMWWSCDEVVIKNVIKYCIINCEWKFWWNIYHSIVVIKNCIINCEWKFCHQVLNSLLWKNCGEESWKYVMKMCWRIVS